MKLPWIILMILAGSLCSAAQDTATTHRSAGVAGDKAQPATDKQVTSNSGANPDGKKVQLSEAEKRGYALGVQFGSDVMRQGLEVNPHRLVQGMMDAITGGKLLLNLAEVNAELVQMQREQRESAILAMQQVAEKNKKDGEAFLATNKLKEGVVALPSGLQYKILKSGDGKKPTLEDKVVCNYRGTLLDGAEIDSSYKRNEPSIFPLKGVIRGWTEALQLMSVGSKWQIIMPPDLAYGERGSTGIGPNETLIFEVELLSIVDKPKEKSQEIKAKPQRSS